ncbi:hypothetical protein BU15DRAFT_69435 [Melanogaster broomeanus]|nr:hypothetical protein BU15DRAFT_69435 [Melanogaster broomeanus]
MPAIQPPCKVLVSGATGYIAAWVVQALLERGRTSEEVFDSYASGDKFEVVMVEDIAKDGAFDEVVKGVDAIEHTASPSHLNAVDSDAIFYNYVADGAKANAAGNDFLANTGTCWINVCDLAEAHVLDISIVAMRLRSRRERQVARGLSSAPVLRTDEKRVVLTDRVLEVARFHTGTSRQWTRELGEWRFHHHGREDILPCPLNLHASAAQAFPHGMSSPPVVSVPLSTACESSDWIATPAGHKVAFLNQITSHASSVHRRLTAGYTGTQQIYLNYEFPTKGIK